MGPLGLLKLDGRLLCWSCALLLAAAVVLCESVAKAQPAPFPIPNQDTELTMHNARDGAIGALSTSLGIPKDSRFYPEIEDRVKSHMRELERQGKSPKSAADQEGSGMKPPPIEDLGQPVPDMPVIAHLRGSAGLLIPTGEDVYNPFKFSKQEFAAIVKEKMPEIEELAKKMYSAPDLPRCQTPQTYKQKLNIKVEDKKKAKEVLYDLAVLDEHDARTIAPELLGAHTIVQTYRPGNEDPESVLVMKMGIKCLPFRMRLTATHRYVHEGIEALLNYDGNPNGKGKLHKALEGRDL